MTRPVDEPHLASGAWARVRPYLPAGVAVLVLRVRFLFTPLTSDEGGYLAVGRAWGRGAVLYRDVWIDRPQGLLTVYRVLALIGMGTPVGVRLLALGACLVGSVACGSIAGNLCGDRARGPTALLVAVVTSVPQYEGFIANAELLSSAAGAVALALILSGVWGRAAPDPTRVLLGGIAAGCALTIKQSGFDAFAAGLVAIGVAGWSWPRRTTARTLVVALGGTLVPLALAAAHGAVTGWQRWLYAVAGYRFEQRSAMTGANWGRLARTFEVVAPVLVPTAVLVGALFAFVLVQRPARRRAAVVLAAWCVSGTVAFLIGGQFHRHYWVLAMFPLGTVAGALVSMIDRRALRLALLAALLVVPVSMTWRVAVLPRDEVVMATSADPRLVKDEHVAAWFDAHATDGEQVYVMCYSAAVYGNTDTDPPYPYLWGDNVANIDGAIAAMGDMLASSAPPMFVADYQRPGACDPSGRAGALLATRYDLVAVVDGIPVYEWRGV